MAAAGIPTEMTRTETASPPSEALAKMLPLSAGVSAKGGTKIVPPREEMGTGMAAALGEMETAGTDTLQAEAGTRMAGDLTVTEAAEDQAHQAAGALTRIEKETAGTLTEAETETALTPTGAEMEAAWTLTRAETGTALIQTGVEMEAAWTLTRAETETALILTGVEMEAAWTLTRAETGTALIQTGAGTGIAGTLTGAEMEAAGTPTEAGAQKMKKLAQVFWLLEMNQLMRTEIAGHLMC